MFRRYASLICVALVVLLASCGSGQAPKRKTNWNNNFEQLSKDPFSLYLAYQSFPFLFPAAKTEHLKSSFRMKTLGYQLRKQGGTSLIMMIGNNVQFEEGETDSLFAFAEQGHQILISAASIDPHLLEQLNVRRSYNSLNGDKSVQQLFLKDRNGAALPFSSKYRSGHSLHGYFEYIDTSSHRFYTLGMNGDHEPDCIVFAVGKGKIFLHATPVAFTNFFLLQQNNYQYLNMLFSNIAEPVGHVYLCSFNTREQSFSDWGVIWNNKATRLALLLSLFALAVYILFEMKRRQKVIPIIAPLENSSVAFVETIGRLYYNKKNHTNLAEKMVQHFLDFVRSNYYLNTNNLDQEFIRNLAAKSGNEVARADTLVYHIKEVQQGAKADEAFLYSLYNQIRDFYHGK